MSRRVCSSARSCCALSPTPARAQFVVIDPGNLVQTDPDRRAHAPANTTSCSTQYQTILRMAQGLGHLDRYRIPRSRSPATTVARWPYGAPVACRA